MKRQQWYAGVWEEVTDGVSIACCECGLCHDFKFKVVKGKVFMVAHLNKRETGQVRRRRKFACVKP